MNVATDKPGFLNLQDLFSSRWGLFQEIIQEDMQVLACATICLLFQENCTIVVGSKPSGWEFSRFRAILMQLRRGIFLVMTRILQWLAISFVITLGVLSLTSPILLSVRAESSPGVPLKVGFITSGPVADLGWNYEQDQGRLYMQSKLHNLVTTTLAEKVPESAEAERVMEKMIAQGNKLIFATSYGYLEPAQRVATRHPEVIFMQCGRSNPRPMKNIGTYFVKHYDLPYVVGVVAGRMTKKNEIGYVAAHPIPIQLVSLNAFTLGARSVNPKVKVHVVWTNTWGDPLIEAEAAKGLIDRGVDVLGSLESSAATVVQTAESAHVYSIGDSADLHQMAPQGWLTGQRFDWGPLYVNIARSVLDHTWKAEDRQYGIRDGVLKLSSFGPAVPRAVQQEALAVMDKIENGKLFVFCGPVKDTNGKLRLAVGQAPDAKWLSSMDFFVPGIEGSLPKK